MPRTRHRQGATLAALTPSQYVDRLYANAGVVPNSLERQAAIDEFGGASDSSDAAARARAPTTAVSRRHTQGR